MSQRQTKTPIHHEVGIPDKSPWAFRRTLDSCIIAPHLTEFKHFLQISGGFTVYRQWAKGKHGFAGQKYAILRQAP